MYENLVTTQMNQSLANHYKQMTAEIETDAIEVIGECTRKINTKAECSNQGGPMNINHKNTQARRKN